VATISKYFILTSYRSGRSEAEVSLKRYKFFKELDNETGLYYYGMRYYAPWIARFVSVDPLQFKYPELTPFQYASNAPISNIDLDGAEAKDMVDQHWDFLPGKLKQQEMYNKKNKSSESNADIRGIQVERFPLYQKANMYVYIHKEEDTFTPDRLNKLKSNIIKMNKLAYGDAFNVVFTDTPNFETENEEYRKNNNDVSVVICHTKNRKELFGKERNDEYIDYPGYTPGGRVSWVKTDSINKPNLVYLAYLVVHELGHQIVDIAFLRFQKEYKEKMNAPTNSYKGITVSSHAGSGLMQDGDHSVDIVNKAKQVEDIPVELFEIRNSNFRVLMYNYYFIKFNK